jgi:hypothetical protein
MSKAEKIILLITLAVLIAFVFTVWLLTAADWSVHL